MDIPVTTAIRALRAAKADFEPMPYDYVEHGGTRHAADCLGVDEHLTVKTIVMETDAKKPFIVLMHGDREISTKQMARVLGVKSVAPCAPETSRTTASACRATRSRISLLERERASGPV